MVRNYCFTLHCPESSSLTAVAVAVVVDSRVFGCRFQHFVVCAYIYYSQLPLPEFLSAFHLIKIRHRTKFGGIRQEMSAFLRNRTPVSSPFPPGIGYPSFKLLFQHNYGLMYEIPESGIFLLVGFGIRENFASEIWNPGF